MEINKKIKKLLSNEDKKNPLTDQQLALKLNVSREKVTVTRQKLNIKSSKERLKPFLVEEIRSIIKKQSNISIRELTKVIQQKGYNASRYLIDQEIKKIKSPFYKKEKEIENKEIKNKKNGSNIEDPFQTVIGYNGTLKPQIQQAKAAVLYPPYGLHTLITGESGVGKSYLARKMFEFAAQNRKISENKFVVFNCADYADNPQLLYSHLFGHVKGAFTGASNDKDGLLSKANNSILFLDEVHRLSPEGQEMLFNVIDNGKYRRLGETETEHKVNLMIIAATTEDIESSLLATFRRRIPLIIELPSLKKRELQEKLDFIKLFIARESKQIKRKIILKYEAVRALLAYTPVNNIGQLESNLKVICAKAYLFFVTEVKSQVEISLDILPSEIRRSFLNESVDREEIRNLLRDDIKVEPALDRNLITSQEKNIYNVTEDIYKYIEEKNQELSGIGIPQEKINTELTFRIEEKISRLFDMTKEDFYKNKNMLKGVIGEKIYNLINEVMVMLQEELPELVLNSQLQYALAIHLDAVWQRIKSGKLIKYPDLENIKKKHPQNYAVAEKVINFINKRSDITIPRDEIGYITMYLNTVTGPDERENDQSEIAIIIVSHGMVASSMLKVANYLLGGSKVKAVNMSFNEAPNKVLKKLIALVKKIEHSKGILLLVDMGSLTGFAEIIEEKTGIKTRAVARVDTVMLMEAIRWSKLKDISLNELVARINQSNSTNLYNKKKHKVLLIYCMTGEGVALKVKDYLLHRLFNLEREYEIITTGIYNKDLEEFIADIEAAKELVGLIGNLRPQSFNSNIFFSVDEIFSEEGLERFKERVGVQEFKQEDIKIDKLIDKNIIFPLLKVNSKDEVITLLAEKLKEKGVVKDGFLDAVKKREEWGVTYIGSGIAIPHADSQYVNYSQAALAIMENSLDWSGYKVEVICMFAIKDLGVECFKEFYKILKENIELIKFTKDINLIKEALLNG
ncbi:PRD domain-containing protein [Iocasia frigidifontis]|uniref:PRD domain-containing protein n=1 Tax=Iocasia fonsfrigidae TaxID=2682810 RepID=A0A8A7KC33_9FIRM|nr:sigma 54-interacting transcriptional regulator [Iocasia fonsfrigidae]QTL97645.1 PRD domain-containing protein [Iocasia fonsfrigidae]